METPDCHSVGHSCCCSGMRRFPSQLYAYGEGNSGLTLRRNLIWLYTSQKLTQNMLCSGCYVPIRYHTKLGSKCVVLAMIPGNQMSYCETLAMLGCILKHFTAVLIGTILEMPWSTQSVTKSSNDISLFANMTLGCSNFLIYRWKLMTGIQRDLHVPVRKPQTWLDKFLQMENLDLHAATLSCYHTQTQMSSKHILLRDLHENQMWYYWSIGILYRILQHSNWPNNGNTKINPMCHKDMILPDAWYAIEFLDVRWISHDNLTEIHLNASTRQSQRCCAIGPNACLLVLSTS